MLNLKTLAPLTLALIAGLGFFAWSALSKDEGGPVEAIGPETAEDEPSSTIPVIPLDGPELDATSILEPEASEALATTDPADPEPELAESTSTTGREAVATAFVVSGQVTDEESGEPVPGATLIAVNAERMLASTQADEQGRYRMEVDDESATHILVQPPEGWNVREPRAALPQVERGGRAEVPFKVLRWPPPVAGDIHGLLQSEGGPWSLKALPGQNAVVLDLVSTTAPRIKLRGRLQAEADGDGGHWLSFEFKDVPRGEYELTLSSLDNYRWHPTSTFVSPPAEGLTFLRYDLDRTLPLMFRVYERTTGEPVDDYTVRHIKMTVSSDNGVLLHTGPLDPDAFPLDAKFEWSLWADGLAPVFGDEGSFEISEGERVAEVRLSQGWGARFLVMGGKGTKYPVEGATILLDGVSIGTTRDGGTLDVYRAEAPSEIEVRYLDWKLTHNPLRPHNGRTPERRGMVIPVLLEPPG
jgi:hypothetical protein